MNEQLEHTKEQEQSYRKQPGQDIVGQQYFKTRRTLSINFRNVKNMPNTKNDNNSNDKHHQSVAIRAMWNRHFMPLQGSSIGRGKNFSRSNQLLYEMVKSQAIGHNYWAQHCQVLLEADSMLIRCTAHTHIEYGTQFANNPFREWCKELRINQRFVRFLFKNCFKNINIAKNDL